MDGVNEIPTTPNSPSVSPAAEPILCLHGLGDRQEAYRHLTPLLEARGLTVELMDAPGHGASREPSPQSARDVARALEKRARALGPCTVVAHSAGATPAFAVAAAAPELVRRLVLIAPVLDTEPDGPLLRVASGTVMRFLPLWLLYYRAMFRRRRPADLDEHIAAVREGLRGRMASVAGFFRGRQELVREADGLRGSHLAIIGGSDPSGGDPTALADHLRTLAPAAEWEVRAVPGAGHCAHQDSPSEVADLITGFLQGAPPTRTRST